MTFLKPYSSHLLSVLRIMAGLLFLQHGTTKYLYVPESPMSGASPMTMGGLGGLFELIGGALLVLGLFTRPVAFIVSGEMAVAYFYAHAPQGFYPILNGGTLAALYCFVFLYLAAAGGGALSIDRLRNAEASRLIPACAVPDSYRCSCAAPGLTRGLSSSAVGERPRVGGRGSGVSVNGFQSAQAGMTHHLLGH